jgi:4-hydroxythreonine-4-phosphate dehydrogenase
MTGADEVVMLLTCEEISCALVTTHIGLSAVPSSLTTARIMQVIRLTDAALRHAYGRNPVRLTVLGLNPHAGEHGLFGEGEEERIIGPAIAQARSEGYMVTGPLSPDTAFLPAVRGRTDGYICMYHDQGLIPLKMLAFDRAVNVTLGLPIVRTSVDHGTAFDIAWSGIASPDSLFAAVDLAARLAARNGIARAAVSGQKHH